MVTVHQPSTPTPPAAPRRAGGADPQFRLSMIAQITDALARSLNFGQAMQELIDGATELLGVERGAVMMLDHSTRTLTISAASGIDEEAMRSTNVEVGFGIAGAVAETGRPLIQKRAPAAGTAPSADQPDSGLCVPIAIHGKLLGVMGFEDKKDTARFTKADLEFAQLIANQAAIALYCDLLHAEFQDELTRDASRMEAAEASRHERRLAAA